MPNRFLRLFSCLLVSTLLPLSSHASTLAQQRLQYDEAKSALAKGNAEPYRRYAQSLQDYPLEPYLAYDELTARLKSASNAEIEQFLSDHGDLPQISWMKLRWLRWLAERNEWSLFVKYYDPAMNFTELDCLYGQYQYKHGLTAEANATAKKLWLVGKSQHQACDALFDQWRSTGQLTEDLRWQRARLALEAGNPSLASYLVRGLNQLQPQGQLLLEVAQKPTLLSQTDRFRATDKISTELVNFGLLRLARQDPEKALALLDVYGNRFAFSESEKVAIARQIGLTLAKRFDPRALDVMSQYDPKLLDHTVAEWRMRLLLRLGRFEQAYQLSLQLPPELASTTRWRYWQARSLQLANPNSQEPLALFQAIAGERDFYGFMAADQIKSSYHLNNQPLALDQQVKDKVRNTPGIRRAIELHDRGQIVDGRREWYHVSNQFNRDELVAQARLGYEMGWYFPAIRSISQAKYWDDLDVRFPVVHRDALTRESQARGVNSTWAFAITRQESAFMADARSHAGAMGLMQLMPATAKETAQRFKIALVSPQQALNPEKNIQLGTAYLSQVYNQFKGNRILASAAYNAGPGRVRQWLRDADHLHYDVWVESIPFDETRSYVQNVLTYSVIYGDKLGTPQPLIEWHERRFDQ